MEQTRGAEKWYGVVCVFGITTGAEIAEELRRWNDEIDDEKDNDDDEVLAWGWGCRGRFMALGEQRVIGTAKGGEDNEEDNEEEKEEGEEDREEEG